MKTIVLLIGFILASGYFAQAQQPAKIPRIGYVSGTGDALNQGPYVEALRQGLKELGYIDGKNFKIEYRGAEGKADRVVEVSWPS
jgi:putative tryptophan/tyrosine transport system substrate-binding protein